MRLSPGWFGCPIRALRPLPCTSARTERGEDRRFQRRCCRQLPAPLARVPWAAALTSGSGRARGVPGQAAGAAPRSPARAGAAPRPSLPQQGGFPRGSGHRGSGHRGRRPRSDGPGRLGHTRRGRGGASPRRGPCAGHTGGHGREGLPGTRCSPAQAASGAPSTSSLRAAAQPFPSRRAPCRGCRCRLPRGRHGRGGVSVPAGSLRLGLRRQVSVGAAAPAGSGRPGTRPVAGAAEASAGSSPLPPARALTAPVRGRGRKAGAVRSVSASPAAECGTRSCTWPRLPPSWDR